MRRELRRPTAGRINQVAETNLADLPVTVSGIGRVLPVVYGEERVAGVYLTKPVIDGTALVFAIGWSHGECEGAQTVYINGAAVPGSGVTLTHYTGASGQTADSTLSSAIAGFTDKFEDIAYTVFSIETSAAIDGWPRVESVFRGRLVYDPRDLTTAWSQNAGLCIRDYLTNTTFGPGFTVTGVDDVADRCDSLVDAAARCQFNMTINQPTAIENTLDLMSVYAECLWAQDADSILLVPDAIVTSAAATLAASDIVERSMRITATGTSSSPTVVTIKYLPSSGDADPWVLAQARQPLSGVDAGDVLETESIVDLYGIRRVSEALRKAANRLRRLQFTGRYQWRAFDSGIKFQRGDVIQLPDDWGLTSQWVRILGVSTISPGLHSISAEHYDDSIYSDEVVPGSTGTVPVGLILPYVGTLPAGYADYTAANGKYIIGAGDTYAVAATGGALTHAGFSGNTNGNGDHIGRDTFPLREHGDVEYAFGAVESVNVETPTHLHTYSTGTLTPDLLRRENKLMKKTTSEGTAFPADTIVFGIDGLIAAVRERISTYGGRLLVAETANADAGNSSTAVSLTTGSTDDEHHHSTDDTKYQATLPVVSSGTMYQTESLGGGVHTHAYNRPMVRSPKKRPLAVYSGAGEFSVLVGDIGMWDGTIGSIPSGWVLADGASGTPDMQDYFIEMAGTTTDAVSGDNTIGLSGSSGGVAHNHIDTGSYYGPLNNNQFARSHSDTVYHGHSITASDTWLPPYYALAFIMYTG